MASALKRPRAVEERLRTPRAPRLRPSDPPVDLDSIPALALPPSRQDHKLKVAPGAPKLQPIPDPPDIDIDFELPPPMLLMSDESDGEEPTLAEDLVKPGRSLLTLLEETGNATEDTMVFSFECSIEEDHDRQPPTISTMVLQGLPDLNMGGFAEKELRSRNSSIGFLTCADDLSSSPILSALRWRATSDCSTCASTPPRDEATIYSFHLGKRLSSYCE